MHEIWMLGAPVATIATVTTYTASRQQHTSHPLTRDIDPAPIFTTMPTTDVPTDVPKDPAILPNSETSQVAIA